MKNILILKLVFLSAVLCSQIMSQTNLSLQDRDCDEARILKVADSYQLIIPECMKEKLNLYDPEFIIWKLDDYDSFYLKSYSITDKQLPFAVIGDFNGDGTEDLAVEGHNNIATKFIALVSDSNDYNVIEIETSELNKSNGKYYSGVVYSYTGPGLIKSEWESSPLELLNDAIMCTIPESAALVYYYKDGKFITYMTAD